MKGTLLLPLLVAVLGLAMPAHARREADDCPNSATPTTNSKTETASKASISAERPTSDPQDAPVIQTLKDMAAGPITDPEKLDQASRWLKKRIDDEMNRQFREHLNQPRASFRPYRALTKTEVEQARQLREQEAEWRAWFGLRPKHDSHAHEIEPTETQRAIDLIRQQKVQLLRGGINRASLPPAPDKYAGTLPDF